jgi:hypothetical protein
MDSGKESGGGDGMVEFPIVEALVVGSKSESRFFLMKPKVQSSFFVSQVVAQGVQSLGISWI